MNNDEKKVVLKNKKFLVIFIVAFFLIIGIIFLIRYLTDPVINFKKSLNEKDFVKMEKIYSKTENDDDKNKIKAILINNLEEITNKYINDDISYEDVSNQLLKFNDIKYFSSQVDNSKSEIEKIKASKDKFALGKEYEAQVDILNAIKMYKEVYEKDKNDYEIAQKYINENKENLKRIILKNTEDWISQNDYVSADKLLEEIEDIFDDEEIINKRKELMEKVKEQEIEKLKNEQEISVEKANIYVQHPTYKSLYPDGMEIIVKNNTNKTVKDYKVAVLAYDSNNYPVKIMLHYSFNSGSYEFLGTAEGANIVPGAPYGKDFGWELDEKHGISKIIAIVKEATYYDGTTWENPYYEYWIKEYKEKPLQN